MTAAELSRKTGIPKQCISDWLGGTRPRDITMVRSIADALQVPVLELLYGPKLQQGKPHSADTSPSDLEAAAEGAGFFCRYTQELFQIRRMPNGTPTMLSKSWETVLGWSLPEIKKMLWQDLIHREDLPETVKLIEKSITSEKPVSGCRHRFLRKDGGWMLFESAVQMNLEQGLLITLSRALL